VIEYKREGSRLFDEFLRVLRDKVTEVIFRVKIASSEDMRDVYADQQESFETRESYGVDASAIGEAARNTLGGGPDEPPEEDRPTEPIINERPKVGRNEPCPCGSGKKYKQCCGKNG
jgi:preprotein translocase subunit SecA